MSSCDGRRSGSYPARTRSRAQKNWRDRLIGLAARHADWVVGYADGLGPDQPAMHAWGTLQLHAKVPAKDDAQPKALACYGLLRTDQDRVLLRFVEGRPVSRITTAFLASGADRLAAEGKRVWVLVWETMRWTWLAFSRVSCLRARVRSRSACSGIAGTKLDRIRPWASRSASHVASFTSVLRPGTALPDRRRGSLSRTWRRRSPANADRTSLPGRGPDHPA